MANKNSAKPQGPWMVATIVLGALLLVSLLVNAVFATLLFVGDGTAPTPTQAPTQQQAPTQGAPVDVSADDDPVLGDADAPVEIIEFSDYECPFCQRFWQQTYPTLKEDYIDTGKAKLVFRDFPLSFHPRAVPAAVAAECVQEELGDEAYFEYHDTLFANQQSMTDQNLRTWAVEQGVSGSAFDECFADPAMAEEVQEDFRAGQAAGVSGTPTLFINGQRIVGAQPTQVFVAAIEAELE